jgi:hypothetical protein
MEEFKKVSKVKGCTVNETILAVLSMAMKDYFINVKKTDSELAHFAIPETIQLV